MTPVFSRVTAIWCGVGIGHLAALGWIWGAEGVPMSRGDGIVLVELLPAERPEVPLARLASRPVLPPEAPVAPADEPRATPLAAAEPAVESAPSRALAAPIGSAPPSPPEFIERVEPVYPRSARLAGIEGAVRIRLRLDAEGRLEEAVVAESSGSPALDDAALAAARASRYAPARLGSRALAAETEATYRFRLR